VPSPILQLSTEVEACPTPGVLTALEVLCWAGPSICVWSCQWPLEMKCGILGIQQGAMLLGMGGEGHTDRTAVVQRSVRR
jgi:hypothetical protein